MIKSVTLQNYAAKMTPTIRLLYQVHTLSPLPLDCPFLVGFVADNMIRHLGRDGP